MQVAQDTVVSLSYELLNSEGELIEKTEEPIDYLHGGYDGIFPRVEQALDGKAAGDRLIVRLEPEDAFGDYDETLLRVEPRELFPANLQVGMRFEGSTEGDAEALPFANESFDTVVTMFGAMFAAHPDCTADELLRVTRSGGRIAMASWTPEGFVGRMLKVTVAHVPPPAGVPSPLLWGDPHVVQKRFGAGVTGLRFERRPMVLAYPFGPEQTVQLFRSWYGPTVRAFAALDEERQHRLFDDLVNLWTEHNTAGPDATRVESEFLEVVGRRV